MKNHLGPQFNDDEYPEGEDPDYLMSFVECDNCGEDTHMDDAIIVSPAQPKSISGHVTNYYCGPVCRDLHQSSDRKGMIGNPFGQMGIDPSQIGDIFKGDR